MMNALVLGKAEGKPGKVYHPTFVKRIPIPEPKDGQLLIKLQAAAFNHSPGIIFDSILGADGCGIVVTPTSHPLYQHTVLIAPSIGWDASPLAPEGDIPFGILGGVKQTSGRGTFAEYICAEEKFVVEAPAHLKPHEAAALPLGGLTAFRALFTKANVEKEHNVLITGIGGGVAIQALQFAVAVGARVWVTSGSQDKMEQAKQLGAQGGVNYKDDDWPKKLATLLPKDRPYLDAVVDSGGGPIATLVARILKDGGVIACYGSTSGKDMPMSMANVLKNHELRGSTMGSTAEFKQAVELVKTHQIKPVLYKVLDGLGDAEEGFQIMARGSQFGKIVIDLSNQGQAEHSKL